MSRRDFYVGYFARAPRDLARWVRQVVIATAAAGFLAGVTLLLSQPAFDPSVFEFQNFQPYTGVVSLDRYPVLLGPAGPAVLFAPGKHGAELLLSPFRGREVTLRAQRIQNGSNLGLEVLPGSIEVLAGGRAPAIAVEDLGPFHGQGEIVDSKCYSGVMNPGRGKVHRDCAVRCISGGVPPALLLRDANGNRRAILISWTDGLLDLVAERVEAEGRLLRVAGQLMLQATKIQRAPN